MTAFVYDIEKLEIAYSISPAVTRKRARNLGRSFTSLSPRVEYQESRHSLSEACLQIADSRTAEISQALRRDVLVSGASSLRPSDSNIDPRLEDDYPAQTHVSTL